MRASPATRALLVSLFALAASAMIACSSSSTTSPSENTTTVVGTYTLITVDGVALPAPGKDQSGAVVGKINSGTLSLTSSNTWSYSLAYTLTNGTNGTEPASGSYTVSGNSVTFSPTGSSDKVIATFSGGNTLTATIVPQVYVFKK